MIRNDFKALFFDSLVKSEREKAIRWLKTKFGRFSLAECEDIFQDASLALWENLVSMTEWEGEPLVGMLYRICRNQATHHLQKLPLEEEWDDAYYPEERAVEADFGYISPDIYRMLQRERLYQEIDKLQPMDRALMLMHLRHVKMKDICKELGYKSSQVVKNRKCLIVGRLRKEIGGQVESTCPLFLSLSPISLSLRAPRLRIENLPPYFLSLVRADFAPFALWEMKFGVNLRNHN